MNPQLIRTDVVAKVTITGLNLRSIKKFIALKKPLTAEVYLQVYESDNGKNRWGRYEAKGTNVWGYWYPSSIPAKKQHRELLESEGFKHLFTSTGLADYRTALKHMHNARQLDMVGELRPMKKGGHEEFTVEWM